MNRDGAVDRIIHATSETGGFYRYIVEEDAGSGCVNSDFSTHLTELGALLEDLDTAFQLQSIPDISTIQVWIDGEEVPKAPGSAQPNGTVTYSEGWSYDTPVVSSVASTNGPSTGGVSLTLSGAGFGVSGYSASARAGGTACESSSWVSFIGRIAKLLQSGACPRGAR